MNKFEFIEQNDLQTYLFLSEQKKLEIKIEIKKDYEYINT
jgi:hypothetical protein